MAGFADLEPLTYFGDESSASLRAVGWLDNELPFARGRSPEEFYRRLVELLRDPFQPFAAAGDHACNLCQFQAEQRGSLNLFVPGDGYLLVCPELITHYINAHHYLPPAQFTQAVLRCPDTRSLEYKRLFLMNGGRALLGS